MGSGRDDSEAEVFKLHSGRRAYGRGERIDDWEAVSPVNRKGGVTNGVEERCGMMSSAGRADKTPPSLYRPTSPYPAVQLHTLTPWTNHEPKVAF